MNFFSWEAHSWLNQAIGFFQHIELFSMIMTFLNLRIASTLIINMIHSFQALFSFDIFRSIIGAYQRFFFKVDSHIMFGIFHKLFSCREAHFWKIFWQLIAFWNDFRHRLITCIKDLNSTAWMTNDSYLRINMK